MTLRIEFDESIVDPPQRVTATDSAAPSAIPPPGRAAGPPAMPAEGSRGDLAMVEDLLDRCWREVDATALNVKLADIVRLLEFKNKLRSAADAEQTFWTMIHEMRREELDCFGDVAPAIDQPDSTDPPRSEAPSPDL